MIQLLQLILQTLEEYRHTSFYCASKTLIFFLHCRYCIFFFNKLRAYGNPVSNKSVSAVFLTLCLCVTFQQFSQYLKISHYYVMIVCNQLSLMLILQKYYDSLKAHDSIFEE